MHLLQSSKVIFAIENSPSIPSCSSRKEKRKNHLLPAFNAVQEGTYWCRECQLEISMKFFDRHSIEVHKKAGKKEYMCEPPCNMSFKRQGHLDSHKQRRTCAHYVAATMSKKCPNCDKKYQLQSQVDEHLRGRKCPQQFKCDQCESGFSTKKALKKHISEEHINKVEKNQEMDVNEIELQVDQEIEITEELLFEGEVDVVSTQKIEVLPEWSQEVANLCGLSAEEVIEMNSEEPS